eukprot:4902878-Lingulodinium_polyedra.AAC.1
MRSDTHAIAAAPRISQRARTTRRQPYGGRCMERARRAMRNAAAVECGSECILGGLHAFRNAPAPC